MSIVRAERPIETFSVSYHIVCVTQCLLGINKPRLPLSIHYKAVISSACLSGGPYHQGHATGVKVEQAFSNTFSL